MMVPTYDPLGLTWLPMLKLYSDLGRKSSSSDRSSDRSTEDDKRIGEILKKLDGMESVVIDGINKKLVELIRSRSTSIPDSERYEITQETIDAIAEAVKKASLSANNPVVCKGSTLVMDEKIEEFLADVVQKAVEKHEGNIQKSIDEHGGKIQKSIEDRDGNMVESIAGLKNLLPTINTPVDPVDSRGEEILRVLREIQQSMANMGRYTGQENGGFAPPIFSYPDSFNKSVYDQPRHNLEKMFIESDPSMIYSPKEVDFAVEYGKLRRTEVKNMKHVGKIISGYRTGLMTDHFINLESINVDSMKAIIRSRWMKQDGRRTENTSQEHVNTAMKYPKDVELFVDFLRTISSSNTKIED